MKNLVDVPSTNSGSVSSSPSSSSLPSYADSPPRSSSSSSTSSSTPRDAIVACSICSRTDPPVAKIEEDPLRTCVDCDVTVHGLCYGDEPDSLVEGAPIKEWRCKSCVAGMKRGLTCALCSLDGGAFTRVSSSVWAHAICSLFIPEVTFPNPDTMDPIQLSTTNSFLALYRETCSICDKKGVGVCRRCDDDECDTHFHVTCAQALGLLVFDHQPDGRIKFSAFCHSHKPLYVGCENMDWIPENSSSLNVDDVLNGNSVTRKIVKKIIYRLAKNLAKSCPYPGVKGADVNAWYKIGCDEFFRRHPRLDRKGINNYIRNCGLGFYHGWLKRKFSVKNEVKEDSVVDQKEPNYPLTNGAAANTAVDTVTAAATTAAAAVTAEGGAATAAISDSSS